MLSMAPLHSLYQDNQSEVWYDFMAMWYHWCWCHMLLIGSSKKPLHSLGQDHKNDVQHHFFLVVWHHCHQHHIMPTALSMVPLHSSGQDNWNEVQHDIFRYVIPSVLEMALCDADGVIMDIISFLRSRWCKMSCNMTFLVMWCYWLQCHMILMASSIAHDTDASTNISTGTKQYMIPLNNHEHEKFSCVIHGITSFLRLRWCKMRCSMISLVMWCYWHQCYIPNCTTAPVPVLALA